MNDWTRRLIGYQRDAAPTQPLDDTPAAARCIGWLPDDVLADAAEQEQADNMADEHVKARIIEYAVIGLLLAALAGLPLILLWS